MTDETTPEGTKPEDTTTTAASSPPAADAGTERPLQDQPDPRAPLAVVIERTAGTGDALLLLRRDENDPNMVRMQLMIDDEHIDDDNIAQFLGAWISKNYNLLVQLASSEFNLRQAVREAEARHRLHLVAPDGSRLT